MRKGIKKALKMLTIEMGILLLKMPSTQRFHYAIAPEVISQPLHQIGLMPSSVMTLPVSLLSPTWFHLDRDNAIVCLAEEVLQPQQGEGCFKQTHCLLVLLESEVGAL